MKGLGDSGSAQPRSQPGQIEIARGANEDASPDFLEPSPKVLQILEEYMAELESGHRPNVDEFVARHPDLADLGDHLRGYLASLEFLHPHDPEATPAPELQLVNGAEGLPPPNPALGQLGDFGLVREIGRGGMGIVYEAVQISLRRRVALKVLPLAAALDTKQLQRFRNETLAAASLHHPHIVPIHAVGTERGVHYYAMQLIEGHSLADVIIDLRGQRRTSKEDQGSKTEDRIADQVTLASTVEYKVGADETPRDVRRSFIVNSPSSSLQPPSSILYPQSSFFQNVAQLGIQAAEALGHAHRLGIVHRDIKPANLILDDEGKLWVTDFGLAMVRSNIELTATGDMLGTLRYMSPEQAAAKRGLIDQRTDIYSLGTTLYELLTLEPAFSEKDRHQLLVQIATQDPPLPRRLNPAIPKDLETIVLKSMAKSPSERYTTAEELAEDLKRFLDDRPIRATRPSIPERALKWCRRHKAVVASATLLALVMSSSAAAVFFERERLAREKVQASEKEERRLKAEQQRLIATLDVADKALYELSLKPALDRLLKDPDPQIRLEDQKSLRKVLAYCQQLADMNSTVPQARFLSAQANRRVGQVFVALGEPDKGEEAYGKTIATLEELLKDNLGELAPLYRRELAQCRHRLGSLYWTVGKHDQAEDVMQIELEELEQLVADHPANPDFRQDLANCRINQGMFLRARGNYQRAEEILLDNQPNLQRLMTDYPELPDVQEAWSTNFSKLGLLYMETGRPDNSQQAYRKAIDVLERLNSTQPKMTSSK